MENIKIDSINNLGLYTNDSDDIMIIREMKAFNYQYPKIMLITPKYNTLECYNKVIEKYESSRNIKIVRSPSIMTKEDKENLVKRLNKIIHDYIESYKNRTMKKINFIINENKDIKSNYLKILKNRLEIIYSTITYTPATYIYSIQYRILLSEIEDIPLYNNEPKVIISFRDNIY